MDFEVTLLSEVFVTVFTLKRLNPLMFPEMDHKPRLLGVRRCAKVAGVRLHVSVVHLVGLEVAFRDEGVLATWMLAFVGPIVGLKDRVIRFD